MKNIPLVAFRVRVIRNRLKLNILSRTILLVCCQVLTHLGWEFTRKNQAQEDDEQLNHSTTGSSSSEDTSTDDATLTWAGIDAMSFQVSASSSRSTVLTCGSVGSPRLLVQVLGYKEGW